MGEPHVIHEGVVTRVLIPASRRPRQVVILAALGLLLTLGGAYVGIVEFGRTGVLLFGAAASVMAGLTLIALAWRGLPREGAWTHQFVFDGEAVYCIDPDGVGAGIREPADTLVSHPCRNGALIVGGHGPLGPAMKLGEAAFVLDTMRAAASDTTIPPDHRSRLLEVEGQARTHLLPRRGLVGVNPSAAVFWPLAALLIALPTSLLFMGFLTRDRGQWDSISLMLLGLGVFGLAMAMPYVWHLNRQRVRRSAALLPEGVSFTESALLVEGAGRSADGRAVMEVPFAELHAVDILDPDHDSVSRLAGDRGVPASGIVLVHGERRDVVEARPHTRTTVLAGIGRTDALQVRDAILTRRDAWLAAAYSVPSVSAQTRHA